MYSVPTRQLNMVTHEALPMKSKLNFSDRIKRGIAYFNPTEMKYGDQHGSGFVGSGIVKQIKGLLGKISPKNIADKAISGRIPTAIKSAVNKLSNVENAGPAFPGEKHPISIEKNRNGNKRLVFNSFLGPSTNVSARLRRGDKPVGRADAQGMRHDLEFALAKTPEDLRKSDMHFIKSLQKLSKEGVPRINTEIGIRGIQFKNKLTDAGIWKPDKFLNPMTDPVDIENAKRELEKLKQKGVGAVLPADMLKKNINKIMRSPSKGLPTGAIRKIPANMNIKPHDLAKLVMKRIVPRFIQMISKKLGRKSGSGIRNPEMLEFTKTFRNSNMLEFKNQGTKEFTKIFKNQFGGFIGLSTLAALAPVGISAATALAPLAIKLGKYLIPKIIGLFKKKGSGIESLSDKLDPRLLFGKALLKIFGPLAKLLLKKGHPNIAKLFGMGGGAILNKFMGLVSKAGKKFVDVTSNIISGVKKGLPFAQKGLDIVKGIKGPRDVAKVLLNQAIPTLIGMIRKKTGIKPRSMGSGMNGRLTKLLTMEMNKMKRGRKGMNGGAIGIATLLGLAGTAAPVVIPLVIKAAKFLIPKIIGLFKRKKGSGAIGGIQKLVKMLKNIIMKIMGTMGKNLKKGKMMGTGIVDFVKNIGKKLVGAIKTILSPEFRQGFVKGFTGVFKETGKIAAPILKEVGPLLLNKGLPFLIKALTKT